MAAATISTPIKNKKFKIKNKPTHRHIHTDKLKDCGNEIDYKFPKSRSSALKTLNDNGD